MNVPKYVLTKTKQEKSSLISEILGSLRDGGARFLQRKGNAWVDIGDKKTKEKIGHALRDLAVQTEAKWKPLVTASQSKTNKTPTSEDYEPIKMPAKSSKKQWVEPNDIAEDSLHFLDSILADLSGTCSGDDDSMDPLPFIPWAAKKA
jgi:hypothetical protein